MFLEKLNVEVIRHSVIYENVIMFIGTLSLIGVEFLNNVLYSGDF